MLKPISSCSAPGCTRKSCPGLGELRHFDDWHDLIDHLSEEDILTYVNRLAEILDDYMVLKERDGEHKLRMKSYNIQKRMLINAAKEQLLPDELEAIVKRAQRDALDELDKLAGDDVTKAPPHRLPNQKRSGVRVWKRG